MTLSPTTVEAQFCKLFASAGSSARRDVLSFAGKPGYLGLGGGFPSIFPAQDVLRESFSAVVLGTDWQRYLNYGPTGGNAAPIQEVAQMMENKGINMQGQSVMITTGSMQACFIIQRLFLDVGDYVIVESPTFMGALDGFREAGAKLIGVPIAEDGLDIDRLEAKLKEIAVMGRRVKLLYTIPNFQNPTGVTMSQAKRRKLYSLAIQYNFIIVEDDAYGELYFEDVDTRPIKAIGNDCQCIYVGSFSKTLFPGVRVGWMVADTAIVERAATVKTSVDSCTSTLCQGLVTNLLQTGAYDNHVQHLREQYKIKRDVMLAVLDKHMPPRATYTRPSGGFFVYVYLPLGMDAQEIFHRAIQKKVVCIPGSPFCVDPRDGQSQLRLSFGSATVETIEVAVKIVCEVISEMLAAPSSPACALAPAAGTPNDQDNQMCNSAPITPKDLMAMIFTDKRVMNTFVYSPNAPAPGRTLLDAVKSLDVKLIQTATAAHVGPTARALTLTAIQNGDLRRVPVLGLLSGDMAHGNHMGWALRNGLCSTPALCLYPTTPLPVLYHEQSYSTTLAGTILPADCPLMINCMSTGLKRKVMDLQGVCHMVTLDDPVTVASKIREAIDAAVAANAVAALIIRPTLFVPRHQLLTGFGASIAQLESCIGRRATLTSVESYAKVLSSSKRPLIIVGCGCCQRGIAALVQTLAEKIGALIASTSGAAHLRDHDDVAGTRALHIGHIGNNGDAVANFALVKADLLLWLGSAIQDLHTSWRYEHISELKAKSCQVVAPAANPSAFTDLFIPGVLNNVVPALTRAVEASDYKTPWVVSANQSSSNGNGIGVTSSSASTAEMPLAKRRKTVVSSSLSPLIQAVVDHFASSVDVACAAKKLVSTEHHSPLRKVPASLVTHVAVCCTSKVAAAAGAALGLALQQSHVAKTVMELATDVYGAAYLGDRPMVIVDDKEFLQDPCSVVGWALTQPSKVVKVILINYHQYRVGQQPCPDTEDGSSESQSRRRGPDFLAIARAYGVEEAVRISSVDDVRQLTNILHAQLSAFVEIDVQEEFCTIVGSADATINNGCTKVQLSGGDAGGATVTLSSSCADLFLDGPCNEPDGLDIDCEFKLNR